MNAPTLSRPARALRPAAWTAALLLTTAPVALAAPPGGTLGVTERISHHPDGSQFVHTSREPVLSGSGRVVAFWTGEQLVPEDTNVHSDVYAINLVTGGITLVSADAAGTAGNGTSQRPAISRDGQWVAFESWASNLVPGDTNNSSDVFLKDLATGDLILVSRQGLSLDTPAGNSKSPSVSADGRRVAFDSEAENIVGGDSNGRTDVFVFDRQVGFSVLVSNGVFGQGNHASYNPSISDDGTRIAFESVASNFSAFDVNGTWDVFYADIGQPAQLVSLPAIGGAANAASRYPRISASGSVIAFVSDATDIVLGDANGAADVFLRSLPAATTIMVSLSENGAQPNEDSMLTDLSADGQWVVFETEADNLDPADTNAEQDVYLRSVKGASTWLVSRPTLGTGGGDGWSASGAISDDATFAVFHSWSTNFEPGDSNNTADVFSRRLFPDPIRVCHGSTTAAGCEPGLYSHGLPRASEAHGFPLVAVDLPNQRNALLFYGVTGRTAIPFAGGLMCVAAPRRRTPIQNTGGSAAGSDCTGSMSLDMNAFAKGLAGGAPHALLAMPGTQVNVQIIGRDPSSPDTVFLTNSVEYVVGH